MTTYPAQIDTSLTLPLVTDNSTPVKGDTVNRLRNAIIAIEKELGVKPSGPYATARARLDIIENIVSTNLISLNGDLGGTNETPLVIGIQGRLVSDAAPTLNQVLFWDGLVWKPGTTSGIVISGDLGGTITPIVIGLQTRPLSSTAPTTDQAIVWDGSEWVPSDTVNIAGDLGGTKLSPLVTGLQGNPVNNAAPTTTQALIWDGSEWAPDDVIQLSGDLGGTNASPLVTGLQGNDVSNAAPANLESLIWDGYSWISSFPSVAVTAHDIVFIAGLQLSDSETQSAFGGRNIDMSLYSGALDDGRLRIVRFYVDVELSVSGIDGYIELYDVTHDTTIDDTHFHFTNDSVMEFSAELIVGSSDGQIRNDVITYYEVRLWRVSITGTDRGICHNARLTISYE